MPTLPGPIAYEELTNNGLTSAGYEDLLSAARSAMGNPSAQGIRAESSQRLSEPEELVSELTTSFRLHQLVQRSSVKGHQFLPVDGQWFCPLVANRIAHRWPMGLPGQVFSGVTPFPWVAWVSRIESPLVTTRWA